MALIIFGLTFLVIFGLSLVAFRLVASSRGGTQEKIHARLEAIREVTSHSAPTEQVELVRDELSGRVSILERSLFARLPAFIKLQMYIRQSGVKTEVGTLILLSLGLGLIAFMAGTIGGMLLAGVLILTVAAGSIPWLYVMLRRKARFRKFEEQFPESLDLLARAVRAGHAFTTGFEIAAKELAEPLATEYRITYDQQNLGLPLSEALQNLGERVPLADVRIFVSALLIQRETGGNLAEILDNLAYVIRERFRLYRDVKTQTAEGRASLYILTSLPPAAALLVYLTNPDYIQPLFTDPLGNMFIVAGVVSQIIGFLVIRKITTLEV
jgi:tight adherence protein B